MCDEFDKTIELDKTSELEDNPNNTTAFYGEKTIIISEKNFEKNKSLAKKLALEFQLRQQSNKKESSSKNLKTFFQFSGNTSIINLFEKKVDVEDHIKNTATKKITNNSESIYEISTSAEKTHNIHDDFEIVTKLAEGGQGYISSAVDKKLGRIIAVKSLHDNLKDNENARHNFITEAKITAQLDHPGIVSVYSIATDRENGLHLAMKLVNGETLADHLYSVITNYRKHGVKKFNEEKSIRNRLNIIIKSCEAIAYAHNRNVMHCDLKPENIMLGQYGETYIMDWGIAKLIKNVNQENLSTKLTAGTPCYFAPEVLNHKEVDQRTDIYTLGVILFETVYLKKAFTGDSELEIMQNVKNYNINSFKHAFNVPVSKDLTAIIVKALAYNPDDRYQTVDELLEDITHFLNNEETIALPDNIFDKMIRWASIHFKRVFIALLIAILSIAVISFVWIFQNIKSSREAFRREVSFSQAYSRNQKTATQINLQMNYVADSIKIISSNLTFLLEDKNVNFSHNTKSYFNSNQASVNNEKPFDAAMGYYFINPYTFKALGYFNTRNLPQTEVDSLMDILQMLQNSLLRTIQESDVLDRINKQQSADFERSETPVALLFFGFKNGLFVTYPGLVQQLPNFQPTERVWYKQAMSINQNNNVAWCKPYADAITQRLTISCVAPVMGKNEKIGVVGADLDLNAIIDLIKKSGNAYAYTDEKCLVREDGTVFLTIAPKKEDEQIIELNLTNSPNFKPSYVFRNIKLRKNGFVIFNRNGFKEIYMFSYIRQLRCYYVEKLNYEKLLEYSLTELEDHEI